MDVFEFIREKKGDLKENTAQFKAMIEPKFRLLSEKINSKITNTLNNPWIEGFNPFEKSYLLSSNKKILGFLRIARAIATFCLWPPDRFRPRSPTTVL